MIDVYSPGGTFLATRPRCHWRFAAELIVHAANSRHGCVVRVHTADATILGRADLKRVLAFRALRFAFDDSVVFLQAAALTCSSLAIGNRELGTGCAHCPDR